MQSWKQWWNIKVNDIGIFMLNWLYLFWTIKSMIGVKLSKIVWNKNTVFPLVEVGLNLQIPLEISCTIVEVIPDILLVFVFTKRKNAKKIHKSMANSSAKNAIKQEIQDVLTNNNTTCWQCKATNISLPFGTVIPLILRQQNTFKGSVTNLVAPLNVLAPIFRYHCIRNSKQLEKRYFYVCAQKNDNVI